MLRILIPVGKPNKRVIRMLGIRPRTYAVWMPYGMPKQRIKAKKLRSGAKRIPRREPTKPRKGVWMTAYQWMLMHPYDDLDWRSGHTKEERRTRLWMIARLSKLQNSKPSGEGGTDNGLWDLDAVCAKVRIPEGCFTDPEGNWKWTVEETNDPNYDKWFGTEPERTWWGVWHTAEPKPVTPELKPVDTSINPVLKEQCRVPKPYDVLREVFGDKVNDAYEAVEWWAKTDEARREAVSRAVEWAVKYAIDHYLLTAVDPFQAARDDFRAKTPGWIKECVRNAIKEGSRGEGQEAGFWTRGKKGQECGECYGTGYEDLGDGFKVPCETCEGTGKLTKQQWHRKAKVTQIDPQEGKDFQMEANSAGFTVSGGTSEATTVLNNPKLRSFREVIFDRPGLLQEYHDDDFAQDAISKAGQITRIARHVDPVLADALILTDVDGYSGREAAELTGIAKSTLARKLEAFKAYLATAVEFPEHQPVKLHSDDPPKPTPKRRPGKVSYGTVEGAESIPPGFDGPPLGEWPGPGLRPTTVRFEYGQRYILSWPTDAAHYSAI